MTIPFSLIAVAVLIKTALVLADQSTAFRRYALAACGAAQMSLGMIAAGVCAWSSPVWADDASVAVQAEAPEASSVARAEQSSSKPSISVEPGKTVVIPPGRPEWISADSPFNREPGAPWAAVVAGPCKTRAECEQELSDSVKVAADEYINFHLKSPLAAKLLSYDRDYDPQRLRQRLVASDDIYGETIQVSFGPMEQLHARVHFDEAFNRQIESRWKELKAKWRLGQVGLIAAVFLGLLGTASGFFKANRVTQGQRGSSLQFAAAATILVIVVAGVSAARYLYWF